MKALSVHNLKELGLEERKPVALREGSRREGEVAGAGELSGQVPWLLCHLFHPRAWGW